MPRRNDSLPTPADSVGLRIDVTPATRDKLRVIAAQQGYSMAAVLRLLVEQAVEDPAKYFRKIPKNTVRVY